MSGSEILKREGYYKFVRNGERFAIDLLEEVEHVVLAEMLGVEECSSNVDMGIITRFFERISVGSSSFEFAWPPKNLPQIREETVRILQERFPDLKVKSF